MRGWLARYRWWAAGAALVVIGVVVAVAVWPSSAAPGPYRPAARARVYNSETICLLTGPAGVAGAAAPVWAGVEKASNATNGQAGFLAATSSVETVGSVTPFVNTLVERQCGVIVAVGQVEVVSVVAVAPANAATRFVAVGGDMVEGMSNVRVVSETSANSVAAAVESAVSGS